MTLRQEKINSLLQEIASSFIESRIESSSLITVMRAQISSDLKSAKIFVSVMPDNKEKEVISMIKKKNNDFKNYCKSRLKIKFLPSFNFEIDTGEKNRARIDELLKNK